MYYFLLISMFKVQQELGELQQKYDLLRSQFTSTSRELQFLKRQHFESQENLAHLRASVSPSIIAANEIAEFCVLYN